MSKSRYVAWMLAAMLAAGTTLGQEKDRSAASAAPAQGIAPGWIERGFARLERAIERLEAKLSGRERGGMLAGCQDMMDSGGMMGGSGMMGGGRPNERWRERGDAR